jgi:hypothetical protein
MAIYSNGQVGWKSGVVAPPYDDAQAFITAANITDPNQQSAIITLVAQLKAYGIWSKMKALYPFVGGTAAQHRFNLKDPRAVDAAYYIDFMGGGTHGPNGYLPNGTTSYADTKLKPASIFNNTTYAHMSYYSRTSAGFNASEYGMGVSDGAGSLSFVLRRSNNVQAFISDFSNATYRAALNSTSTDGSGLFVGTQQGTNIKLFKQNTLQVSNTSVGQGNPPNRNVFIGALNDNNTAANWTDKECAFASIGDGLTDTEAANFYTAVQTFQTTLNRHVGIPIVADADAQAFLNAAVITSKSQATAINTLVTDLKTANIWTKMKAIYPFVGGTAEQHRWNLKNTAQYKIDFMGGGDHTSQGYLPNGTTAYANTNLNPSTAISNGSSSHFSLYCNTNAFPSANGTVKVNGGYLSFPSPIKIFQLGFWRQGSGQASYFVSLGGETTMILNTSSPTTAGLNLVTRTSSTLMKFIQNNSILGSDTTSTSAGQPNLNMYLGARNGDNVIDSFNNMPHQFASMGDGLTDAEAAAFYTAVQTYQLALGRNV